MKRIKSYISLCTLLVLLVACGNTPNFKKLNKEYGNVLWSEVGDDGSYLRIDTNPHNLEDNGLAKPEALEAIKKVNKKLNLPDYLFSDMQETTSLDGKQTEKFKNVVVSWTYHPDNGLEVTYKRK